MHARLQGVLGLAKRGVSQWNQPSWWNQGVTPLKTCHPPPHGHDNGACSTENSDPLRLEYERVRAACARATSGARQVGNVTEMCRNISLEEPAPYVQECKIRKSGLRKRESKIGQRERIDSNSEQAPMRVVQLYAWGTEIRNVYPVSEGRHYGFYRETCNRY